MDKNTEALQMINEFFSSNKIEMTEEVKTALQNVFEENDFDGDLDDPINIYFKNNKEDYLNDTKCSVTLDIELNKLSSGTIFSHYNYLGKTKVSYSENIILEENGDVLERISEIAESKASFNENEFNILVIEQVSFLDGELARTPRLYIYIPFEEAGD